MPAPFAAYAAVATLQIAPAPFAASGVGATAGIAAALSVMLGATAIGEIVDARNAVPPAMVPKVLDYRPALKSNSPSDFYPQFFLRTGLIWPGEAFPQW